MFETTNQYWMSQFCFSYIQFFIHTISPLHITIYYPSSCDWPIHGISQELPATYPSNQRWSPPDRVQGTATGSDAWGCGDKSWGTVHRNHNDHGYRLWNQEKTGGSTILNIESGDKSQTCYRMPTHGAIWRSIMNPMDHQWFSELALSQQMTNDIPSCGIVVGANETSNHWILVFVYAKTCCHSMVHPQLLDLFAAT